MNKIKVNLIACLSFFALSGCNDESTVSLDEHSVIYCAEGSPETFNPEALEYAAFVPVPFHAFPNFPVPKLEPLSVKL